METRTITQGRIFILNLNTFGRAEDTAIAAISDDYNKLVSFYLDNLLSEDERYRDDFGYRISFRSGPLQRFNPCHSIELNQLSYFHEGIYDIWIDVADLTKLQSEYYWV